MRVSIERDVRDRGLIFKNIQHWIWATVDFTEEEKHVICSTGLLDQSFYTRPEYDLRGDGGETLVSYVLKTTFGGKPKQGAAPKKWCMAVCPDQFQADIEEQKIKEAFQNLKAVIEEHNRPASGTTTLEL